MKIVRKSISFPEELADRILERAKESNRSFSAQVVYELTPKNLAHSQRYGLYTQQDIDEINRQESSVDETKE